MNRKGTRQCVAAKRHGGRGLGKRESEMENAVKGAPGQKCQVSLA